MIIIKDYKTLENRDLIVADMKAKGYRLKEEQMHFDGNHLLFTDESYIEVVSKPPRQLASEIDDLKAKVDLLSTKIAKLEKVITP